MKKRVRRFIAFIIRVIGDALAFYVGIVRLIIINLISFFEHLSAGDVTLIIALGTGLEVLMSLTIGGAIWVLCDILASKVHGYD